MRFLLPALPIACPDRPYAAHAASRGWPRHVLEIKAVTGAEDFSFYQEKVLGLFLFVGGMSKGLDPATAASHHTAGFRIDESGLTLGVKTLATLAAGKH